MFAVAGEFARALAAHRAGLLPEAVERYRAAPTFARALELIPAPGDAGSRPLRGCEGGSP